MVAGMLHLQSGSGPRVSKVLFGGSRREVWVLAITTSTVFWGFALSSAVAGVGWYRSPGICTGIEAMAYTFDLNPVLYLPYWIAGWGRCHPVFYGYYHLDRSLLAHLVEPPGSPQLYMLTIVWWALASYGIARIITFSYVRVRPVPTFSGRSGTY